MSGAPAADARRRHQALAVATSFLALFSIVGIALYGLPFFYDFFVRDLGWSRQQVTSGNALSKLIVGPLFGFVAGMAVDRFGPRRLMLVGILVAGLALVGLGSTATLLAFYSFYLMNALGNVLGGPLPNQVLLSGWFEGGPGAGAARRWESRISASASAACWCRSSRTRSRRVSAGARRSRSWGC